jgi:hypothetical protein
MEVSQQPTWHQTLLKISPVRFQKLELNCQRQEEEISLQNFAESKRVRSLDIRAVSCKNGPTSENGIISHCFDTLTAGQQHRDGRKILTTQNPTLS